MESARLLATTVLSGDRGMGSFGGREMRLAVGRGCPFVWSVRDFNLYFLIAHLVERRGVDSGIYDSS
jgi:hypothetical protein